MGTLGSSEFVLNGSKPAVALRLTPELVDALRQNQASGGVSTIKFGADKESNVVTAGDVTLNFTVVPDQNQFVISNQTTLEDAAGNSEHVGNVCATIQQRIRLLQTSGKRTRQPGQTAPDAKRAKRVCIQLENPVPQPIQQPAADSGSAGSTLVGHDVVKTAARTGSLRLTLIALLAGRPYGIKGIQNAVKQVAQAVPGWKIPDKHEIQGAVNQVASYRAPGQYVLHPGLTHELQKLSSAAAGASEGSFPISSPSTGIAAASVNGTRYPGIAPITTPKGVVGATIASGSGQRSLGAGSDAVEPWIEKIAARINSPHLRTEPITTEQELLAVKEQIEDKYVPYFKLGQLLGQHSRLFKELADASAAASTPAERGQIKDEVMKLYAKHGRSIETWEAACKVLHAELLSLQQKVDAFDAAAH